MEQRVARQRVMDQLGRSMHTIGEVPIDDVAEIARRLDVAQREGRLIAICGNGGSAATAQHMAADLNKNTGRRFRCVCLSDNTAHLTALANDEDYDHGFSRQLDLLERGDVLVVISASGTSPNIIAATRWAHDRQLDVLGLLGMTGGKALARCDASVVVPSDDYGAIEDAHLAIVHALVVALRGEA